MTSKGLRQFVDDEQQRAWMEGEANLTNSADRSESLERRFKYAARFEKLLRRPQAQEILEILRLYGETCIPIPRPTERYYWSVSCLPSTSDKPLVRVNASWMELFTLLPDRRRTCAPGSCCICRISPPTDRPSQTISTQALLDQCVLQPEDVSHFFWKADTFGVKVRGSTSIREFLAPPAHSAPSDGSTSPT